MTNIPGAKCPPFSTVLIFVTVNGGLNILIDSTLSLAPLSFIAKLHRPVREKVLLAALMGMGLLASAASIRKTMLVKEVARSTDLPALMLSMTIYGNVELFIGILAACLPYTKSIIQRALARIGVDFSVQNSVRLSQYRRETGLISKGNRGCVPSPSNNTGADVLASVGFGESLADATPGNSGESAKTLPCSDTV